MLELPVSFSRKFATIFLDSQNSKKRILLHAANLDISDIKVDDLELSWNLLSTRQELEINFVKKLSIGKYDLKIIYKGKITDDLVGFFRSKTGVEKNGLPTYAYLTQFVLLG